jgi:hypothetical protein
MSKMGKIGVDLDNNVINNGDMGIRRASEDLSRRIDSFTFHMTF